MTFPAKSRIFEPAPESKSLLVLFFRKEQESSFVFRKRSKKTFISGASFSAIRDLAGERRSAHLSGRAIPCHPMPRKHA
jgi:hypothetical protein